MSELLIHVGFHKSGTTWLQKALFNRNDLGFDTPWGRQSHLAIECFVLANAFKFNEAVIHRKFAPGIQHSVSQNLVPVITHENLCGSPFSGRYYGKEVAERLYATFPNAKILIQIREQRSSILSHYRQYVWRGGADTIEQFIGDKNYKTGFGPKFRLDHLEYDLFVQHYHSLFGSENVLVLQLEQLQSDIQSYITSIYKFTGHCTDVIPSSQVRNMGWGGITLNIKRFLNKRHIGKADWSKRYQSLSYRLVNKLCIVTDSVISDSFHKKVEQRFRKYIEKRCNGYFIESNNKLSTMISKDLSAYNYMI